MSVFILDKDPRPLPLPGVGLGSQAHMVSRFSTVVDPFTPTAVMGLPLFSPRQMDFAFLSSDAMDFHLCPWVGGPGALPSAHRTDDSGWGHHASPPGSCLALYFPREHTH